MQAERIPNFAATFDDGTTVDFYDILADGPVVLFFYPKAFTPGCTAESCHFRDLAAEFAEIGAQRIGVSRDDVATQARFRDQHALDFPLIADPDGSVAKIFGAKRFGPMPSKRQTFVIGTDAGVLGVIASELNMQVHAADALTLLGTHYASDDLSVQFHAGEDARRNA